MACDVQKYVHQCVACKTSKAANEALRPPMGNFVIIERPWQKLYVDFMGPFPRTKMGFCYILVVLDAYSRFVLLEPMRDANSKNLVKFLQNKVFNIFSVPETVLSDNGKQFTSKMFAELIAKYKIKHILTAKYSPQVNASERINRSILAAIRAYLREDHTTWDLHLDTIASALRNAVHQTTGTSPSYLVFGQHHIGHASDYALLRKLHSLNDKDVYLTNADRLSLIHESVLRHLSAAYKRSASHYNLRSRRRLFFVGQLVYVRNFTLSNAVNKYSAKLAPKFKKAIVKQLIGNVACQLVDESGSEIGVYHIKDIKSS